MPDAETQAIGPHGTPCRSLELLSQQVQTLVSYINRQAAWQDGAPGRANGVRHDNAVEMKLMREEINGLRNWMMVTMGTIIVSSSVALIVYLLNRSHLP